MDTKEFISWLVIEGELKESVAKNRASNCKKVENALGNLNQHYKRDGGFVLLKLLKYSLADKRDNLPAKHGMKIDGDIYNNTSTYRQAVKKYMAFKAFTDMDM